MNLLGKAEASGRDPYVALLTYCSTPIDNSLPSPAQLPNHRDYPTQLPISEWLQRSQALASHREQLQNWQNIQRKQYDSRSTLKLRKPIYQGEEVVVFQPRTETWTPAQVREEVPRSYIVKTADGSAWAKMQWSTIIFKLLEKTASQVNSNKESLSTHRDLSKPSAYPQLSSPELTKAASQSPVPSDQSDANLPMTTRSGHVVKNTSRLDLWASAFRTLLAY